MKVYTVLSEYVSDCDHGTEVLVYKRFEDAKRIFEEKIQELKDNDAIYLTEDYEETHSERFFCVYESGNYSMNHVEITIEENEIL